MYSRLTRKLLFLWKRMLIKAKWISFPGFDGIPLYNVMVFFWRSIINGSLTTRASAISFSFFMALLSGSGSSTCHCVQSGRDRCAGINYLPVFADTWT